MAEQPIDKDGLIKAGAINSIIEEFDKWKKKLEEIDVIIDKLGKSTPIIQPPKNTEELNKLLTKIEQLEGALKKKSETETKLSAIEKERAKLAKQTEAAEAKKVIALNKENKELLELRAETNKLNKEQRDNIKTAERQSNAYFKLSDSTRDYKNESKRLGAELLQLRESGKQNTKEYRELAKAYNTVTKNAQLGDAQLKKLDKTVGDNQRSVGAYENATRKLSSALGTLGIAFGISTVVRSATSLIRDYDQAVTDLGAITQKTAEELKPLNEQARALGESTQFSATEITQLQIELAKLGFTVQEISDSTGGIANFAAATGVEIPRAAALAGSALRAFNLEATEIDRVVSTLGVATTKTALDFAQLENGLSTVAPVAASFGFSIEDTTALLGQLANAGFDASSSATATRNILLNLADANGKLAKELGKPIKNVDDLASGLQELQSKGVDLAEALELTDKRSVAAFSTFITGSGSLVELRDSITDVNEELTKMAEDRLDSVSGAMKLLESAWEGFILNLNESVGASEVFQTSIKFIADNLSTIIPLLMRVGAYYLIYTQRVRIANTVTAIFGSNSKGVVGIIPKMITGLKGLSLSFRGLGTAIKSIPFAAWIALATEAIMLLWDWIGATNESTEATDTDTEAQKANNDEVERGNKIRGERRTQLKDINTLSKNLNDLSQDELKALKTKLENQKQEANNNLVKLKILKEQYNEEKRLVDQLDSTSGVLVTYTQEYKNLEATRQRIKELQDDGAFSIKNENRLQQEASDLLVKVNGLIKDETKAKDKNKEATDRQNKALEEQRKAYQSLIDLQDELWFRNLGNEDQEVVKRMQQLDDEMAKIDADTMMRAEEREALIKALTEDSEKDIQAIRDKFAKERKDKEIKDEEERIARDKEAITKHIEALEEQALLAKEVRTNELLKSKLDKDEFDKQSLASETLYLQELIKIRKDAGLETIELENQLLSLRQDNQDKSNKEFVNSVASSVTLLKELYSDEIDKAIESQNRLIANSQKTIDNIKQAAMAGNLQAKESILAEEKAIEKSQKRIEQAQKRKQRMEFISTGINTFNSSVQSGKTGLQALGETAVTMSGLAGMLAGLLPSFDVGADRLTGDGRGIDGKGGFLAINHPDERIMTAEQNAIIGYHHKNSDIANVMSFYNKGLLKPAHEMGAVALYDNSEVLERIDKGFSKINNWNISVDELFGTISVMIEKSKGGNIHKSKRNYKA